MTPPGAPSPLSWLHPFLALLATAFLAHAATLGLRSRERGGAPLRAVHTRRAPLAAGLILAVFVSGLASTLWLRPDLAVADSIHFRIGLALVCVLGAGALLSRRVAVEPLARRLHPALGLLALLLAALQVFFGLRLLRL